MMSVRKACHGVASWNGKQVVSTMDVSFGVK
jgi:hypothetical protein